MNNKMIISSQNSI